MKKDIPMKWIRISLIVFCVFGSTVRELSARDLDMRLLGRWPGGPCHASAFSGDFLYLGRGAALDVLDVSDPAGPVITGEFVLPAYIWNITLDSELAYVAADAAGLQIIDISSPGAMYSAGSIIFSGLAYDCKVRDGYAYVAVGDSGLAVIDVGTPASPVLVRRVDTQGDARSLVLYGNYAYLASGEAGVDVIDISEPASAAYVGSFNTDGTAWDVAAYDNVMIIADGNNDLVVADITNPAAPSYIRGFVMDGSARGVDVTGNRAYVAAGDAGLHVVDITDPLTMDMMGSVDTPGNAVNVSAPNGIAFVSDDYEGLHIIDAGNLRTPAEVGDLRIGSSITGGVYVTGDLAVLATGNLGLQIVNISVPETPAFAGGNVLVGSARDVVMDGNIAYVAAWDSGFQVIDVSTPLVPPKIGSWITPGNAQGIDISGEYAYIADGNAGLQIVRISDPGNPDSTGSAVLQGYASDVAVSDGYACVALSDPEHSGLEIVDVSNPADPVPVTSLFVGGGVRHIHVRGGYAYLSDADNGVHIIDITSPGTPVSINLISLDDVSNVFVTDTRAYITVRGLSVHGVYIYDITNPENVRQKGFYNLNGDPEGIFVRNDTAFVHYRNLSDPAGYFHVIDVFDVGVPSIQATVMTGMNLRSIAVRSDTVYAAADNAGMRIGYFGDPEYPDYIGYHATGGSSDRIQLMGNYAFVSGATRLTGIDISNAYFTAQTDVFFPLGQIVDFCLSGSLALVLDYVDLGDGTTLLHILDVSNPYAFDEIVNQGFDILGSSPDMAVQGDSLFIADDKGLHIIDLSNPSTPQRTGFYASTGLDRRVDVFGDYAMVGDTDGLHAVKIRNTPFLDETGMFPTQTSVTDVRISGHHCYLALMDSGLQVVDISDPGELRTAGYLRTGYGTHDVVLADNRAYVGHGRTGISVLRLSTLWKTSPSSVEFDTLLVGEADTLKLSVINPHMEMGDIENSFLTGPNLSEFALVSGGGAAVVAPLDTLEMALRFAPLSRGSKTAYVIISSDYDSSPDTIRVSATAVAPVLEMSGTSLAFGEILAGSMVRDSVLVTNAGDADLDIDSYTFFGADTAAFEMLSAPLFLAPGDSQYMVIVFHADTIRTYSARVDIVSSGGNASVFLSGRGVTHLLTIPVDSLDFGPVQVGSQVMDSLMVINSGSDTLNMGPFKMLYNYDVFWMRSSEFQLLPSDTGYIRLICAPQEARSYRAPMIIESNAVSSPDRVWISGRGVAAGLFYHQDVLAFGHVPVGSTVMDSLLLINYGEALCLLDSVHIRGGDSLSFALSSFTQEILPEDSGYIKISFSPDSVRMYTAWMDVYHDGNPSPDSLGLEGYGGSPEVIVSTEQIDFGNVLTGTSAVSYFHIWNNGEASLEVDTLYFDGPDRDYFDTEWTSFSLLPGDSLTLSVSFMPEETRVYSADLVVFHNALSSPDTMPVAGRGLEEYFQVITDSPVIGTAFYVSVPVPDDFTAVTGALFYRIFGKRQYHRVTLQHTGAALTGSIPGDSVTIAGAQYYISISSEDSTLFYPGRDPAGHPVAVRLFMRNYNPLVYLSPRQYRMISIPMILEAPEIDSVLTDDYGEYDTKKWRMYRYDPESQAYREYPVLRDSMTPGKAFWLVTQNGTPFDVNDAYSHVISRPFTIVLKPGWNQFANPFAFPVAVDSMHFPGDVEKPVWYNGFDYMYDETLIRPWDGYFIHNASEDTISIAVPPVAAPDRAVMKQSRERFAGEDGYVLHWTAVIPETDIVDGSNYLGFRSTAESGRDRYDFREAPPIGDYVRLSVMDGGERWAGNFKPPSEEGSQWEMEISSSLQVAHSVAVTVTATGILPPGMKRFVFDLDQGCLMPADTDQFVVSLSGDEPVRRFKIILGTDAFAEDNAGGIPLAPLTFYLGQNYPNPFNPSTRIHYQLARRGRVVIEIFNVIGNRVRILLDAEQNTGEHTTVWDGMNDLGEQVSAGVYFYQMTADNFKATRKMILIR